MNSGFPGAQSPARLVKVLRLLAHHHVQGLSIAELTAQSGLDRSTARRLLMVLAQTGYAAKDAASGRYRLGVEAMLTGLAAMAKPPIFEVCHPVMVSVARRSGDTVFLIIRVGDFAHCLHVQPGSTVLHAHSLMSGQIRLLGQGTASLALAASLRDAELDQIYQRRRLDYEAVGISQERLMDMVRQTRKRGHSLSVNLLTSGATGVGLAIEFQTADMAHSGPTAHIAAISVANHDAQMDAAHQVLALQILREELLQAGIALVAAPKTGQPR
jgi:DNA-binding IclR family transcriptional regulator